MPTPSFAICRAWCGNEVCMNQLSNLQFVVGWVVTGHLCSCTFLYKSNVSNMAEDIETFFWKVLLCTTICCLFSEFAVLPCIMILFEHVWTVLFCWIYQSSKVKGTQFNCKILKILANGEPRHFPARPSMSGFAPRRSLPPNGLAISCSSCVERNAGNSMNRQQRRGRGKILQLVLSRNPCLKTIAGAWTKAFGSWGLSKIPLQHIGSD